MANFNVLSMRKLKNSVYTTLKFYTRFPTDRPARPVIRSWGTNIVLRAPLPFKGAFAQRCIRIEVWRSVKYTKCCFVVKKMEIMLRFIFSFFFCKVKGLKLTFPATFFFFTQISSMEFGIQNWRFAKFE